MEDKQRQRQKQMRGFFASLKNDKRLRVGLIENSKCKCKSKCGVLRCAQNDKRLRVGLIKNKQLQVQKQMRGFFAALRMTSV